MPQQGYTMPLRPIDRRTLLRAAAIAGGSAATIGWFPAWAQPVSTGTTAAMPELAGEDIALRIGRQAAIVDGRSTSAIGINGTVPAPLLRLREGPDACGCNVTNDLDEDSIAPLARPARAAADRRRSGHVLSRHQGAIPASLYEFPLRQNGHLLVSQPFGAPGAARSLRPDRDRPRGRRSGEGMIASMCSCSPITAGLHPQRDLSAG
jgi:hypothetical protein